MQSEDFEVKVGVHQGSVLSTILFIMVFEATLQEFRGSSPSELLYADHLVLTANSVEEVMGKYAVWKEGIEARGLKVNTGKTKALISGARERNVEKRGRWPCAVCRKGGGSNSILCKCCNCWVHKRCRGVDHRLHLTSNVLFAQVNKWLQFERKG